MTKPLAIYAGSLCAGLSDLVRLFWANKLPALTSFYEIEALAWLRMSGGPPADSLARLAGGGLFCTAHPDNQSGRPLLDEAEHLDHYLGLFPDALLLVPLYPDAETAIDRAMMQGGGKMALTHALWHGVSPDQLPALWRVDLARRAADLARLEARGARVLRLDAEGGPEAFAEALAPHFPMARLPNPAPVESPQTVDRLDPKWHRLDPASAARIDAMVPFCLGVPARIAPDNRPAPLTDLAAMWDGEATVRGRDGAPYLARFGRVGGRDACIAAQKKKLDRASGVISEALLTGHRVPMTVDMNDSRRFGLDIPNPPVPVITYCRRPEARNVVLWPLPVYHSIGEGGFVVPGDEDTLAFEDKHDVLFWRGALSGHCSDVNAGKYAYSMQHFIQSIARDPGNEALWQRLGMNSRYRTVQRLNGKPGMDVAFTNSKLAEELLRHPRSAHLCAPSVKRNMIRRYRYVLSLRGYDTGSNFISAANSASVVLKEEDGWELFYTPLFKPWEHYIPLASGADDVEDKLAWARANPDACKRISANARESCRLLGNSAGRARLLEGIMAGLAARAATSAVAWPEAAAPAATSPPVAPHLGAAAPPRHHTPPVPAQAHRHAPSAMHTASARKDHPMFTTAPLKLFYCKMANFGDALSVNVVSHLSGREVAHAAARGADLAAIGSLMGMIGGGFWREGRDRAAGPLAVWGTGSMGGEGRAILDRLQPFAVRGPVTAALLGLSPHIAQGDPGLFAADLLTERPAATGRVGVIAHHKLVGDPRLQALTAAHPDITLIDPRTADALSVIRQIAACRLILSSSLHGLIVADSLGVPNLWLDPAGNHITPELKFLDYAGSIGRGMRRPLSLDDAARHLDTDASDLARYQEGIERSKAELRDSFAQMLDYVDRPSAQKRADAVWVLKGEGQAGEVKPGAAAADKAGAAGEGMVQPAAAKVPAAEASSGAAGPDAGQGMALAAPAPAPAQMSPPARTAAVSSAPSTGPAVPQSAAVQDEATDLMVIERPAPTPTPVPTPKPAKPSRRPRRR